MIDALLRDALIAETLGDYRLGDAATLIEDTATGLMLTTLVLTDTGLAAIGRTDGVGDAAAALAPFTDSQAAFASAALHCGGQSESAACESPVPTTGMVGSQWALRAAAEALVAAWDADADLASAVDTLRAVLSGAKPARTTPPRQPRSDTKQASVLALLRRAEGATIVQIIEATGWQQHTVRGFLAGLKKKGIQVEALERIRLVGPNKQGSKGSYSIYRIAEGA
jgi:hypothetical protein